MSSAEKNYQAYLLRLWRDNPQGPWRASLQSTKAREAHLFADLQTLITFLEEQTTEAQVEISLPSYVPIQTAVPAKKFAWRTLCEFIHAQIEQLRARLQFLHRPLTLAGGLVALIALVVYLQTGTINTSQLLGTVAKQSSGVTAVPETTAGLTDVIAIAAGNGSNLALKRDGTVVAWGNNDQGQTDVPADLTDVIAIAAGDFHSLALKRDGTVVAWGNNDYGQTDVPAGLHDVTAIAAGRFHSVALKRDGTVVTWGNEALAHMQATGAP